MMEIVSYLMSGLACLPAKDKFPYFSSREGKTEDGRSLKRVWEEYQTKFPSLDVFYENTHEQVCVICGKISGNLEVIDIDNKWDRTEEVLRYLMDVDETLGLDLVVNRTKRHGFHLLYRCEEIESNQKLARYSANKETVIETRGEKGLIIAPPSEGYETIKGSMSSIPVITQEQRLILLEAARGFDEVPVVEKHKYEYKDSSNTISGRFNAVQGVDEMAKEVLREAGWRFFGRNGVTRPGKKFGLSATWGYCPAPYFFYVWSSNAHPFESNHAYSPYQIIMHVKFNGDWKQMNDFAKQYVTEK